MWVPAGKTVTTTGVMLLCIQRLHVRRAGIRGMNSGMYSGTIITTTVFIHLPGHPAIQGTPAVVLAATLVAPAIPVAAGLHQEASKDV
jgi:hypothetical protein